MTVTYKIRGNKAEDDACRYLQAQGLQVVARNYHCKMGEIDLIMRDRGEIVFVEVRLRNSAYSGSAFESVDYFKEQKLIKAATHFLCQQNLLDKVNCRFDVIGISYAQSKAVIEWMQDAFSVDNF